MKPVRRGRANPDLFRERLDAIIDMRHGLVRLTGLMQWSDFDESFDFVSWVAAVARIKAGVIGDVACPSHDRATSHALQAS